MKRTIDNKFAELRASKRKALIPYLVCGYPSQRRFLEIASRLEGLGADLMEIGIPHSDPLADGPTIRYASSAALARGLTVGIAFKSIEKLAVRTSIPLVAMTYMNIVIRRDPVSFARSCSSAGLSGIIIPDLTLEESRGLREVFSSAGLDVVLLVAPTTPEQRVRKIAETSQGFLYLVSVTGTTGARKALPATLADFTRKVKSVSPNPVCVGFGISKCSQAREVSRYADGVVVGSALIDQIRHSRNAGESTQQLTLLMSDLRKGIDS